MTRIRKSLVATGIALLALGAVALPAAASGHTPDQSAQSHSAAIWDNHAPVIPADNHAPLTAFDNHAPLTPVDNHMP
ncbi:hypothetical protein ACFY12_16475 [Streptomyces sp. NPDC001339]|uniref:hypothetical protein n=1 Tax=Streptomyces sp. NPDC001339 TaxID=3364563 RepID=UPI00367C8785